MNPGSSSKLSTVLFEEKNSVSNPHSAPILNFSADPYLDSEHIEIETLCRKTYR